MRDKGKIKGLPRPGFGAFAGLGFIFLVWIKGMEVQVPLTQGFGA